MKLIIKYYYLDTYLVLLINKIIKINKFITIKIILNYF